jgi:hypothetical protein
MPRLRGGDIKKQVDLHMHGEDCYALFKHEKDVQCQCGQRLVILISMLSKLKSESISALTMEKISHEKITNL